MHFFLIKSDTSYVCEYVTFSMLTLQESCQRLIFLSRFVMVNSRSVQVQLFVCDVDWIKYKQTNEAEEKFNHPIGMFYLVWNKTRYCISAILTLLKNKSNLTLKTGFKFKKLKRFA